MKITSVYGERLAKAVKGLTKDSPEYNAAIAVKAEEFGIPSTKAKVGATCWIRNKKADKSKVDKPKKPITSPKLHSSGLGTVEIRRKASEIKWECIGQEGEEYIFRASL